MKKLFAPSLALAMLLTLSLLSPAHGRPEGAANVAIGSTVSDFTLKGTDGKNHSLASLRGKQGTVLIFISTRCPVSNGYNERMEQLWQDYKARGVAVIGINSNSTEPLDEMKQHATEKKLTFPVLKDNGNRIADMLGARVTPEAYFLDPTNKLLYRGRIDDKDPRRGGGEPLSNDLRNAIDAALGGRSVEKTEALAFGCSIKRA